MSCSYPNWSRVAYVVFEIGLPLAPSFLVSLRANSVNPDSILIAAVMYTVSMVNAVRNGGGLLLAFFLFLGLFGALFMEPNWQLIPGSPSAKGTSEIPGAPPPAGTSSASPPGPASAAFGARPAGGTQSASTAEPHPVALGSPQAVATPSASPAGPTPLALGAQQAMGSSESQSAQSGPGATPSAGKTEGSPTTGGNHPALIASFTILFFVIIYRLWMAYILYKGNDAEDHWCIKFAEQVCKVKP
jgi:hypothetical protein